MGGTGGVIFLPGSVLSSDAGASVALQLRSAPAEASRRARCLVHGHLWFPFCSTLRCLSGAQGPGSVIQMPSQGKATLKRGELQKSAEAFCGCIHFFQIGTLRYCVERTQDCN